MENEKKSFLDRISLRVLISIVAGGILGWLYYKYIGCYSGNCPLTSNPYLTIIWGALIGYLLNDLFKKKKKNTEVEQEENTSE